MRPIQQSCCDTSVELISVAGPKATLGTEQRRKEWTGMFLTWAALPTLVRKGSRRWEGGSQELHRAQPMHGWAHHQDPDVHIIRTQTSTGGSEERAGASGQQAGLL